MEAAPILFANWPPVSPASVLLALPPRARCCSDLCCCCSVKPWRLESPMAPWNHQRLPRSDTRGVPQRELPCTTVHPVAQ